MELYVHNSICLHVAPFTDFEIFFWVGGGGSEETHCNLFCDFNILLTVHLNIFVS